MDILGEHIVIQKGKMPRNLSDNQSKRFKYPYIDIKAFEKGSLRRYTDGEKCLLCDNNDILIVWDGARCGLVGKAISGAVGSTLAVIKPKESVQREYVYYFLKSQFLIFNTRVKGVGIPHLDPFLVHHSSLIIPSLPEQHRIVAKLEELLSELEKGKEQLHTALDQLKVYRQAVLKYAFEGKLTNNEKLKSKNEKIENGELPKGWKWVKLGEKLDFVGSGITPKGGREVYQSSGVIFIRSQNVYPNKLELDDVAYISDKIDERMKRTRVQPDDVLLNITGASIGRSAFVPSKFPRANVNQHVCILRSNQNTLFSKYLSSYLNSSRAQSEIMNTQSGATRQGLNFEQIRNLNLPICPIEEQHRIVQEIESRLSVADKLEETITASLQQSETLRQSILKKAFEGKLV
ncbi:MAG: restriction endonuclease subunit S [Bacteroidota bacterium]|nr:restriction endonuclease subunit S [Bacteroidota bacterium]